MYSMKKHFDGSDVCHLTVNCLIEKTNKQLKKNEIPCYAIRAVTGQILKKR